jgi:hypothetical protein
MFLSSCTTGGFSTRAHLHEVSYLFEQDSLFLVQNKYFEQLCGLIRDGDYTGILINNWKCSKICNMEQEFSINWYYWHISCISNIYSTFSIQRRKIFKDILSTYSVIKCVAEHVLGNCGWLCRNAISQLTEKFNYREGFCVQLSKTLTAKP